MAAKRKEVTKVSLKMRIDPDILEFFKNAGPGYTTRINQVLREYMEQPRES